MRPMILMFAVLAPILPALPVAAGSLSGSAGGALALNCTDDATASFAVSFSGAACSVDGVAGRTQSPGVCVTEAVQPEIFILSNRDTFSLQNTVTRGVLDGRCSRS